MKKLFAAFIIVLAVSSTSFFTQADSDSDFHTLGKTEIVG